MNLSNPSKVNLSYILQELTKQLDVANHSLMDPDDYDLEKYGDIKYMYDIVIKKGRFSISETEAFLDELRKARKK